VTTITNCRSAVFHFLQSGVHIFKGDFTVNARNIYSRLKRHKNYKKIVGEYVTDLQPNKFLWLTEILESLQIKMRALLFLSHCLLSLLSCPFFGNYYLSKRGTNPVKAVD